VLYLDAETGLIDRVHSHIRAEFLRQTLWVGKWLEYRDCDGIKKERRRAFSRRRRRQDHRNMTAEHLIEHVHFDNGFPADQFVKPFASGRGSPAG